MRCLTHRSGIRSSAFAVFVATATLVASPASAQEAAPASEDIDDTIVVTGQRIRPIEGGQVSRGATLGVFGDRDLFDTPISTKSFTADYIADIGALNSNEIASRDASFTTTNAATLNGATAGRLRGFRIEPFESTLDGFASVAGRRYALEFVDRVDLLKGPSAVFTGLVGGVGGTINYISKKPLNTPLTRITGLYDASAQFGGQADISRRFGRDDAFGLRVNLAYRDGETAIDGIDEKNVVAHVAFNARLGPARFDIQYGSLYSLTSGGAGGYFYPDGVPIGRAPDGAKVSGPGWDRREMHDQFVRAQLNVDLGGGWSAFADGALSRTQERFVGLFVSVLDAAGTASGSGFAQQGEVNWGDGYSFDAGLRGKLTTGPVRHSLSLIFSYLRGKSEYSDLAIDPGFTQPNFNIYNPSSIEGPAPVLTGGTFYPLSDGITQGLVVADELSLFEGRLLLTGGMRYTKISSYGFNYAAPSPDGPVDTYRSDNWSPAVAALFKITPAISVYANYLKAVEAGATAPIEAVNFGEIIAPSISRQYEAGIKGDFGHFGATAAVFDIERPSIYLNAARQFGNFGRQRHRGLELDLFGTPVPGVRLLASYTHLDAKLLQNEDPTLNGNRPVSVPKDVLVIGGDADVPGLPGAALLANMRYSGNQVYDLTNVRTIPAFAVFDVGARYRFTVGTTRVTARLNVNNVFDKDYFQSTDFTAQTGAPRTLRLTLAADF